MRKSPSKLSFLGLSMGRDREGDTALTGDAALEGDAVFDYSRARVLVL